MKVWSCGSRDVLIIVKRCAFVWCFDFSLSPTTILFAYAKCNSLQEPDPANANAYAPISSHHILWYTYTPIKKREIEKRSLVLTSLLSCAQIF